jgi:hypothetical protein
MHDLDRFKLLFGPYRTPAFRYGERVQCQVRGLVVVCSLTWHLAADIWQTVAKRSRCLSRR